MRIEDTSNNSEGKIIDLRNIDMPFLNVIAEKTHLTLYKIMRKILLQAMTTITRKMMIY
jgi:poly(3-hydroxyalkanoate) synthetase